MIASVSYIEESFKKYNHQIFDDCLPIPVIKLSRAKTRLGQMAYKRKVRLGHIKYYDFRISISTAYDLLQDALDDVIIHEMIHYYIAYKGIRDSSAHGKMFRSLMSVVNTRHGRHVSVSVKQRNLKEMVEP